MERVYLSLESHLGVDTLREEPRHKLGPHGVLGIEPLCFNLEVRRYGDKLGPPTFRLVRVNRPRN
jgi:hypothetical protein